jgi:transcriptional regulator with XRE-family HTH domain
MTEFISAQKLGAYMRFLRERQRVKQFELADDIGVSSNTLCAWEQGYNLARTADVFNTIIALDGSIEELKRFEVPDKSSNRTSGRGRIAKARKIIDTDRPTNSDRDGVTE